ncbi:MAG: DUF2127 domain-containing protein [Nitrososphaeraceae archaeon]
MNIKRPLGITIISILIILNGSFLFLAGILTFILTSNFPSTLDPSNSNPFTFDSNITSFELNDSNLLNNIKNFIYFIAGIIIVFSLIHFLISYGLLKAKSWARTTTIIISMISIVTNIIIILIMAMVSSINPSISNGQSILGGPILTIVLNTIIVYYLYRKEIQDYFHHINGKSSYSSSLDDLR